MKKQMKRNQEESIIELSHFSHVALGLAFHLAAVDVREVGGGGDPVVAEAGDVALDRVARFLELVNSSFQLNNILLLQRLDVDERDGVAFAERVQHFLDALEIVKLEGPYSNFSGRVLRNRVELDIAVMGLAHDFLADILAHHPILQLRKKATHG